VQAEEGLYPRTDLSDVDVAAWEVAARRASSVFAESTITLDPAVSLVGEAETRWFVSTEGHRLREGLRRFRASVAADTLDSDGTALSLHDAWDTASPEGLPSPAELELRARELEAQLVLLAAASEQGPYRGPAVLSGKASAVFFHEIFGHRVEGHRLKQVEDAQTFRNQVGQSILPSFLSVYDDPTLPKIGEQDLRGFYRFDDQGVRAERVQLVKEGVLQGFLESRSPVADRGVSNAHGRRQMGNSAVSRQGNLIVETSQEVPDEELRRLLLKAARKEGLEYGLLIDDIGGGFTFTGRDIPNAFQIDVVLARRVWVDGRPDELVRGIDLIGTPLATFSRIKAAGPTIEVFNGTCGAESGWVPVSASAPSLFVSQIETQRKSKGQSKPPLTPPPGPVAEFDAEIAARLASEDLDGDLLLGVLANELDRAVAELKLPDLPGPAWAVASVFDGDAYHASADFGALRRTWGVPGRPARLEVVVGSPEVNSSRMSGGAGGDLPEVVMMPRFVLGDRGLPIARDIWITADMSYKAALQRLAVKLAARRATADDSAPPDWTDAEAVVFLDPSPIPAVDQGAVASLATELSSAFRRDGSMLTTGQVLVGEQQGRSYLVDTHGMRIVQPEGHASVYAFADVVRPDGLRIFDRRQWVARSLTDLPSTEEMTRGIVAMVDSLTARAAEEAVGYYEGPVVFEGEAAASLFRYLVPPELRGTPPAPSADRSYQQLVRGGPRLGRRLLPAGWTIDDDPGSLPAHLAGGFRYDREGVPAEYVQLVSDGYIRDFVMSRVPRADLSGSNGHARGGISGVVQARLSNWTVTPKRLVPARRFEREVASMRRSSGVPAVLVVRAMEQGWEGSLPRPTDAVWRYPDGREIPVVSLEFQGVDRRTLRGIAAASGGMQVHPYLATNSGAGRAGTVDGVPMVLTSPGRLLIGEIEVVFPGGRGKNRPRYPKPSLGGAAVAE
ncbi:MAG: metallopeptidase TldD-related protein, partial [Myxococcota bacterium]|nr:metallopeptidase TldD-related protein [Myxococcota bacterium]